MYKTLTGIRARRISRHLEEQNGCHPGSKGGKDQLIVSNVIYEDCRRRKKNLSTAWIDYQKAFDSVSHSWLEKSTEMVGVNSKIVRLCNLSMETWNRMLQLKTKREVMQLQPIQIRRGIFQRDSPLPLLFCIALILLTHLLNRADCEYQGQGTQREINPLPYMDGWKLLGRSEDNLENEIIIIKAIRKDISMNFGLEVFKKW